MESSGTVPVGAADLSDLGGLVALPGPFATVYLNTEAAIDNAAQRSELRWRPVREELAEAGADAQTLAAIDQLVPDAHRNGEALAVVAAGGRVRLAESFAQPPAVDVGRWDSLPSLVPLIEWRQMAPAHLMVLVNREGADLIAFRPRSSNVVEEVSGDRWPLHAAKAGGWSERRYQATVEENWKHNAGRVADELSRLVAAVSPRIIAVCGDVRARQLLLEALPAEVSQLCVELDGGRGADGSEDEVASEAVRQVATAVAADTRLALEKFKEERGEANRAVEGTGATLAALARGQVGLLLIHDDPANERRAFFGDQPTQVGLEREELEAMGAQSVEPGRVADVAVRAALLTGADIRVIPEHAAPTDGIGAILRWS